MPPLAELRQMEVRRLIDRAIVRAGNKDEANALLDAARAAVNDRALAIRIRIVDGVIALSDRQFAASQDAFRAAGEMAARQSNLFWEAQALNNLAYSSKKLDRYEESVKYGLQALALAQRAKARRIVALVNNNLGSAYSFLGEMDSASEHIEHAVPVLEAIGDRLNLMMGLGELGLIRIRQGQTLKAIANFQRAYQIAKDLGRKVDAERNAENLAFALIRDHQWDRAYEWNERASELALEIHDKAASSYLARNRAQIAWGRGKPDEAAGICNGLLRGDEVQAALRWELFALLGVIDTKARRFRQANREFEAARKIIDETRSDLLNSDYKVTLLSRLILFYQEYVDDLVQQNDDLRALRIVESSRARVLAERMGSNPRAGQFPNVAALENLARSTDSSFLTFWIAPLRSFAWLITANGIDRFGLPPSAEIETLVTNYRKKVELPIADPKDPSGPALWNKLLCEIAPRIPKGSRLIVIPDGPLHRMNLETMVVPTPAPHYWIEDVELAVAPSITIAASQPVTVTKHDPSLLLIGAPDYSGTDYGPLPKAAEELDHIKAHFTGAASRIITGREATPAAYGKANPGGFSLIHFAAHAEANAERPLESAIVLSPEGGQRKLYARDVIDVPIHADLVTISSCKSAGVRAYAGEGLIGFAWAFLQKGARNVVAGLWDASDASTEALMDRFYAGISSGQDPVSALRNAKLALLKGDVHAFHNPFYWAPFQAYVGSAAR